MKIRTEVTVIGLLMFNFAFGQSQEKYREFAKEAFDQVNGTAHPKDRFKILT